MIRFLAQSTLMVIGNALGLLVAAAIVSDFHVSVTGFTLSLVFFTVAQIILAPFILQLAIQYVPAFRGGIALVTTFVVLLLTTWLTSGLRIESATAWVVAPFVIWLISVVAGVLLPLVLFKKALASKTE